MSRSYRIRIPIEVLLSNDRLDKLGSFSMPFDVMQILPADQMQELLKKSLLAAGCSESGDEIAVPCKSGQTALIDVVNRILRLRIEVPKEYETSVYEEVISSVNEQIANALTKGEQIGGKMGQHADRLVAAEMAPRLRDLAMDARKVLNAALKETYREAIKTKASQIGNVTNISESSEGGSTRIRIEVAV